MGVITRFVKSWPLSGTILKVGFSEALVDMPKLKILFPGEVTILPLKLPLVVKSKVAAMLPVIVKWTGFSWLKRAILSNRISCSSWLVVSS